MERTPAGTPKIVHVRKAPFDVYIGRAWAEFPDSKWRNPIHLHNDTPGERAHVLQAYEDYILKRPDLLADLPELAGKTLGCWCAPKTCHGDVLVKLFIKLVLKQ